MCWWSNTQTLYTEQAVSRVSVRTGREQKKNRCYQNRTQEFTSGSDSRSCDIQNGDKERQGECFKSTFQPLQELCPISTAHTTHLFSIESTDNSTFIYFYVFKPSRVKYPWLRARQRIPMREKIWVDGFRSSAQMRREQYFLGDIVLFCSTMSPSRRR